MTDYICRMCHYVGQPKLIKRGSGKTEIIMWLLFPLGIPYSIWRMFGKHKTCLMCEHESLVFTDSIIGKRLLSLQEDISDEALEKITPITQQQPIKHDPKITALVAGAIDETLRDQTGTGLKENLEGREDETLKELQQRQRGATHKQNPEDW